MKQTLDVPTRAGLALIAMTLAGCSFRASSPEGKVKNPLTGIEYYPYVFLQIEADSARLLVDSAGGTVVTRPGLGDEYRIHQWWDLTLQFRK